MPSLSPFLWLAAAVCVTGCQTQGYRKHDAAAWNSRTAAVEIQTQSQEIDGVIGTLSDLVSQPAADAKPQFLRFNDALDRLASSANRTGHGIQRLARKRVAYFEVWDKEIAAIKDDDIRKNSEHRKAEVSEQFDAAIRQYDEAQNNLRPLVTYLQDIRKALGSDLTRQGLAAARSSVDNARERAQKVQNALAQSAAELDVLSTRMASYRVQEVK